MQKHVNLVDLVKSFPTSIYLQNLASIQKRTSPVKFAHLAEKSGKGSISNLSTKVGTAGTVATDITGFNNAPAVNTAYPAHDVYDFGTPATGPPNDQYYACWAFNPSSYSAYTLTLGFFTMFCLTPS